MITALYADGGVITKNPSPIGGTWAYCFVNADGQRIIERSGVITPEAARVALVTNNHTELIALIYGLAALPSGWRGTVYSDSQISLLRLFKGAPLANVPFWLEQRVLGLRRSGALALMTSVLLDGHPTKAQLAAGVGKKGHLVSEHNVWCDRACQEAAAAFLTKERCDTTPVAVPCEATAQRSLFEEAA